VDVDRFRQLLEEERVRVLDAIEYLHKENPGSIEDETEDQTQDNNHMAETATATLDREIDYTLEENSENVLSSIDGALERITAGTYGSASTAASRSPRSGSRRSLGDAVHRLQAAGGARLSEPRGVTTTSLGSYDRRADPGAGPPDARSTRGRSSGSGSSRSPLQPCWATS
jgi:RNA polymerase-binding transcription factor DksA